MRQKGWKKGTALVLAAVLVSAVLPMGAPKTYAADAPAEPDIRKYASKADLQEKYDLEDSTVDKLVQKVYFGYTGDATKPPQVWKIAGKDVGGQGDNIVLFADSSMGGHTYFSDWSNEQPWNKDYPTGEEERKALGITYSSGNPEKVNVNHYGTSNLRDVLRKMTHKEVKDSNTTYKDTNYFTAAQQALMNETTITTNDTYGNNGNYTTTDVLYAPYGVYNERYVTVGTNKEESGSLNNGLRIDVSNWGDYVFWLRAPDPIGIRALVAGRGIM